jgi:hypothetical protein
MDMTPCSPATVHRSFEGIYCPVCLLSILSKLIHLNRSSLLLFIARLFVTSCEILIDTFSREEPKLEIRQ